MRRKLLVLALSMLVSVPLTSCGTKKPSNIGNICEIFREKGGWYDDAKASSEKWGTEIPVMMAIIRQESSFTYHAKPKRTKLLGFIPWKRPSSAKGYAQAIDSTWASYLEDTGGTIKSQYDFEDAIDFVGWYLKTQGHRLAKVPLHDTYNQYLVYHEGTSGFKRGSYRKKRQVIQTASLVKKWADTYRNQLAGCEHEFQKTFWQKLWPF